MGFYKSWLRDGIFSGSKNPENPEDRDRDLKIPKNPEWKIPKTQNPGDEKKELNIFSDSFFFSETAAALN